MTRAWLLIGFGLFTLAMGLFCWALCAAAARGDRMIAKTMNTDCFTRYRLHVHDCDVCRPPDIRCAVGVALRHEAVETLVDKEQERIAQ